MKKAEIIITLQHSWSGSASSHIVGFDSADVAKSEFERIAELLKRRENKSNDIPKFLELEGINKLTCNFDHVTAISFVDLKKEDDAVIGIKDAFPHLNWKP